MMRRKIIYYYGCDSRCIKDGGDWEECCYTYTLLAPSSFKKGMSMATDLYKKKKDNEALIVLDYMENKFLNGNINSSVRIVRLKTDIYKSIGNKEAAKKMEEISKLLIDINTISRTLPPLKPVLKNN